MATDEPGTAPRATPWPRRAVPHSLLIGSVAVILGVGIAVMAEPAAGSWATLTLGLATGGLFGLMGFHRWRAGGPFPVGLALIPVAVLFAIALIAKLTGTSGSAMALPFIAGMLAGLMFSNAGAALTARQSPRPSKGDPE